MDKEPDKYPAEKAIKELAKFLDENGGERPLAIISDSYDRQEVAKNLEHKHLGPSLVLSGGLLAAADYEQDISLAALTYVNDHYLLAKNVASMRLLVQIYSMRRNQDGEATFPFASSSSFRDVVLEIEQTGKQLPSDINGGVYEAELGFVQYIWQECMAARHSARAKRLEQYADKLKASNTPVAYLHWGEPDEQIRAFLSHAEQQGVPVREFEAELSGEAKELDLCWSGGGKTQNQMPLAYEAQTLEEAARAAQKMLRQWLHKHKKDDDIIGIIDYDRALIRRLHSLLMQEDGIFLQETKGWPANNLLVGKALLALASGESKSERIAKLQNVIVRKQGHQWVRLPRDLAKGKINDGLQQMEDLNSILDNFAQDSHFQSGRSISDWFGEMAEIAETGFFKEFFEQDSAALDLRRLLHMLADEFAPLELPNDKNYKVGEVRRLLFDSLSSIDLNSSNNDSRVQLVPPGRFTTRKFEAMLLAGADADTLPQSRAPQLFSNEVRAQMNLPTLEEKIAKQRKSTALLLGNSCEVGAVWYGQAGISPYIDLMSKETKLLRPLKHPWKNQEKGNPLFESKVKLQEAPKTISVSACVDLLECPYKYHAQHVLKLSKDPSAAIGQRDKYGSFVHAILEKFHKKLEPELSDKERTELLRGILKKARDGNGDEFKNITEAARRYFAWEFEHYLEIYVAEINELLGEQGYGKGFPRIEAVEERLKEKLPIGIEITGKADRIDRYGENSYAVVDVKTGNPDKYKDYKTYPQLPLYMKLYESSDKTICFKHSKFWVLSLESGANNVSRVPAPNKKTKESNDIPEKALEDVFDHYQKIFDDALKGKKKPLRANGVQSVCQYCEYGGLCRKKHWGTQKDGNEDG